ncbi:Protein of unknown function Smg [hydrothermal vent metagenome]|uniref:Protein Smg homolog n=1 Tax=hydrothermal vent metagenome TaxID=652676 RepID=A0A3B0ZRJ1_9ZZZZ
MKENVIDVLMYLFEHYMDSELEVTADHKSLKNELIAAGFTNNEVDKTFDWLDGLAYLKENPEEQFVTHRSIRIFAEQENQKLSLECRGFLIFLEQIQVLDSKNRELVIDRVMALEGNRIELRELKWVILMVLFNQPGHEAALAWIEDQVFEEVAAITH